MAAIITLNISTTLHLNSKNNVSVITIKALGGNVTVLGSGPFVDNVSGVTYQASPIILTDGSCVTLSSPAPSPIDSLVITPSVNAEIILQS